MKRLLAIIVVLWPATAMGWPAWLASQPQTPHPAVVRVIAPEKDGYSMGSGSLVAIDANHGLVITNWHVVRDAAGPISVVFPDGFRSGAVLLKTDRDWDLAALAIQRPQVLPIALSTEPPRPGDMLTIAGYGSDSYRAVSGRCTEYLSPGGNLAYELIEVDAGARNGDSGGPIFNARGEIAGVLFGSALGRTAGSYCGRVRTFVASVVDDFQRLPGNNSTMVAQAAAPMVPVNTRPVPTASLQAANPRPIEQPRVTQQPLPTPPEAARPPLRGSAPSAIVSSIPQPATASPDIPPTRADQVKTILAAIGVISILFHGIRLAGSSVG